jgi:hypothetical protein
MPCCWGMALQSRSMGVHPRSGPRLHGLLSPAVCSFYSPALVVAEAIARSSQRTAQRLLRIRRAAARARPDGAEEAAKRMKDDSTRLNTRLPAAAFSSTRSSTLPEEKVTLYARTRELSLPAAR